MADKLDLVVTLGGDGTVLWTGALVGTGPVPPLVSFALGSLGFMTPFPLEDMSPVLSSVRASCTAIACLAIHRCRGTFGAARLPLPPPAPLAMPPGGDRPGPRGTRCQGSRHALAARACLLHQQCRRSVASAQPR